MRIVLQRYFGINFGRCGGASQAWPGQDDDTDAGGDGGGQDNGVALREMRKRELLAAQATTIN